MTHPVNTQNNNNSCILNQIISKIQLTASCPEI